MILEKPIILSPEMATATREGRKTQERIPVKPAPLDKGIAGVYPDRYNKSDQWGFWLPDNRMTEPQTWRCPYGDVGDRLWVKEAAYISGRHFTTQGMATHPHGVICTYYADSGRNESAEDFGVKLTRARHLPRAYARTFLTLTEVRIERLFAITSADCIKEGLTGTMRNDAPVKDRYHANWDARFAKDGFPWDANPWVWLMVWQMDPLNERKE